MHTQSSQRLSQGARGKGGKRDLYSPFPLTPMFLMPVAGATYRAGPSRVVPASPISRRKWTRRINRVGLKRFLRISHLLENLVLLGSIIFSKEDKKMQENEEQREEARIPLLLLLFVAKKRSIDGGDDLGKKKAMTRISRRIYKWDGFLLFDTAFDYVILLDLFTSTGLNQATPYIHFTMQQGNFRASSINQHISSMTPY